jgi:hypothetical protein
MARQIGELNFEGVVDGILFYRMEGRYYARMHCPVTSKQFWNDRRFEGSRRSCARLALGSKLAGMIYRKLPKPRRLYAFYCVLKREAMRLLKGSRAEVDVLSLLAKLVDPRPGPKKRGARLKRIERNLEPGSRGSTFPGDEASSRGAAEKPFRLPPVYRTLDCCCRRKYRASTVFLSRLRL